jgi:sarcosine oxidase, subunit alpha
MPYRLNALRDPVEIEHDGEPVAAERGEPIAVALLGSDRLPLARSPKLHRPRGPYCLRGGCDGCLARVDGVPNVMTCLSPVRGGERVETQNVLGSRDLDVLRATDFLFPRGIDHHRLLAGVRGLSAVVQSFARRVAGLGRLPAAPAGPSAGERLDVEFLIVGGGAAGLSAAEVLGRRALLVDDGLELGGSLAALAPEHASALAGAARTAGAELRARTTALGLYREPASGAGRIHALLIGPGRVSLAVAGAVLLATGAHDGVACFDRNDTPGVMSARAGLRLWRAGVAADARIVLAGRQRFAARLAELAAPQVVASCGVEELVRAGGRTRLSSLIFRSDGGERRVRAGALLVDAPGGRAFELAVQAGARVRFDRELGYLPEADRDGGIAERVFAAGSLLGAQDSPREGAALARRLKP